ncbi:MAG: amidohydrolase family protein [Chloroflexi bacterium]|nr:amidohydrolase family protein [Chloroflexota bacterium]
MAELPFVDTHVHFSDLQDPNLHYSWLQPGWKHPFLGDIEAIQAQRYWADEYVAETRFTNVSKSIHVQAALGIADPVEETRWLQAFADRLGHPHGIVAECHLAQPDAASVLERHMQYPNMRGVRDFGAGDYPRDPAWRAGYALLEQYDLVPCLDSSPETYPSIKDLALAFPGITISLDHAGFPRQRDAAYFAMWKQALADLAEAPNVVIKISGLGMGDNRWTVDSIRPWVLTCIETFGVERSFFGTNWPVDRMYSSYPDVVNAYAAIISGFSRDEQVALFSGNAERIFRI